MLDAILIVALSTFATFSVAVYFVTLLVNFREVAQVQLTDPFLSFRAIDCPSTNELSSTPVGPCASGNVSPQGRHLRLVP